MHKDKSDKKWASIGVANAFLMQVHRYVSSEAILSHNKWLQIKHAHMYRRRRDGVRSRRVASFYKWICICMLHRIDTLVVHI